MTPKLLAAVVLCVLAALPHEASAQHEHHGHTTGETEAVSPPRVFLDKNPRIVWYQLNRLSNGRLLLVERATDHAKYKPVYTAILIRAGMSRQDRDEALAALVKLEKSDPVSELLAALTSTDEADKQQLRVGRQLARMVLGQSPDLLAEKLDALRAATESANEVVRATGFAGLVMAGRSDEAWSLAKRKPAATLDYLRAVALVPKADVRAGLRTAVVESLADSNSTAVRRAAIVALASIPAEYDATFRLLAPYVANKEFKTAAVRTLLTIPPKRRDRKTALAVVGILVKQAEQTPPDRRTLDDFVDAMQLADQLLAIVPTDKARAYRDRLRAVSVRLVRIHTVQEEMRYDTPYFAVEAGRSVQILLQNEDLMPHNLVITAPGALQEVAEAGAEAGPAGGAAGKQYVPDSDKVLFATDMVQAGTQVRLTFRAPTEPGEYPYVCTFPRHWMRMYGVMVVVRDLDAWLKDPTVPADPTGSNRSFVKSWTLDDLKGDLAAGMRGRSPEIGERIFKEATCALCHKVRGQGGAVGPELTDVLKRWKNDRVGVLREVVDPSHKIEPKYAVHVIQTVDGKVISGVVASEDKESISIVTNPEAPRPTVVARDDIDEMVKSSKSMMPKALLDRFTKDEIYELLSYLETAGKESSDDP